MLSTVKTILLRLLMWSMSLIPVNRKKIVFSSFRGRQFSDNPKAIYEDLVNDTDLELVWIANPGVTPDEVKSVPENSFRCLYELATAGIWIDNCRKKLWIRKRKGQFYIQTWHGNITMKKVEGDAVLSPSYVKMAKHDSAMADLFLSGSKWLTNNYKEAFWYDGVILELGYPRSDILYKDRDLTGQKVHEFYHLPPDTKLLLYAPTFRNSKDLSCYCFDYEGMLDALHRKWGGEWKILMRLHPNLSEMQNLVVYNDRVLNGLLYQEINELIVACDVMITDYSSCMFDALEADKKVFIYATDLKEYYTERGRYFSFDELPFPLAESNDQLLKCMENFAEEAYSQEVASFKERVGLYNDGHATERVVEYIEKELNGT